MITVNESKHAIDSNKSFTKWKMNNKYKLTFSQIINITAHILI